MQQEQSGFRSQEYSEWHRWLSISRYIPEDKARHLSMIDQDNVMWIEYADKWRMPVLLVETARDVDQDVKPTTVMFNQARLADIPAITTLYTPGASHNPASYDVMDIIKFRCQIIWPQSNDSWITFTPKEYAEFLWLIREESAKLIDRRLQRTSVMRGWNWNNLITKAITKLMKLTG